MLEGESATLQVAVGRVEVDRALLSDLLGSLERRVRLQQLERLPFHQELQLDFDDRHGLSDVREVHAARTRS